MHEQFLRGLPGSSPEDRDAQLVGKSEAQSPPAAPLEGALEGDPMIYYEEKICLDTYSKLLKIHGWHDALKSSPAPGTYTVIVNQYMARNSVWIRNGYRYDGEHWLTPKGKITTAPVLAWYREVD